MGLGIPPLKTKILLESNLLKPRILVRRLAVCGSAAVARACGRGARGILRAHALLPEHVLVVHPLLQEGMGIESKKKYRNSITNRNESISSRIACQIESNRIESNRFLATPGVAGVSGRGRGLRHGATRCDAVQHFLYTVLLPVTACLHLCVLRARMTNSTAEANEEQGANDWFIAPYAIAKPYNTRQHNTI